MAGEDYVHVRLTPAGEAMAGKGAQVRITKGRVSLVFKVGQSQRVTKNYEWAVILQPHRHQGQPVFEVTTAPTGSEPATPAADIE